MTRTDKALRDAQQAVENLEHAIRVVAREQELEETVAGQAALTEYRMALAKSRATVQRLEGKRGVR